MDLLNLYKKYSATSLYQSVLLAFTQSILALFFISIDFLYSKNLTVKEFGIWKQFIFVMNLTIPLLSFGIAEGYKYYLAKEGERKQMFANTFTVYTYISIAFLVAVGLANLADFLEWIDLKTYYMLSFLMPVAYFSFVINKALRYAYIDDSNIYLHTKITIAGFVLTGLVLLCSYFFFAQIKPFYLFVGILLYILIYFTPIAALILKGNLTITNEWLTQHYIIKVLKQGLPLYLATFIGTLTLNTGMLIVNTFEDIETFALFSVGALEIPVFAMLSAAVSQRIYPDLVRLISSGEKEKAKKMWMKTTLQVSYITYPLIILLMFFAEDLIYLVYSPKYEASIIIFKTYLLIGLFRNNYYGALITASGQTKYITLYAVIMLLTNAVLSFFLYSLFGVEGVVYGTLTATIIIQLLQLNHEKIVGLYFREFLCNYKILLLITIIFVLYFSK